MSVCVECLIGKQKKPILFKVTEPSSVPVTARVLGPLPVAVCVELLSFEGHRAQPLTGLNQRAPKGRRRDLPGPPPRAVTVVPHPDSESLAAQAACTASTEALCWCVLIVYF